MTELVDRFNGSFFFDSSTVCRELGEYNNDKAHEKGSL